MIAKNNQITRVAFSIFIVSSEAVAFFVVRQFRSASTERVAWKNRRGPPILSLKPNLRQKKLLLTHPLLLQKQRSKSGTCLEPKRYGKHCATIRLQRVLVIPTGSEIHSRAEIEKAISEQRSGIRDYRPLED
jgi:hypothetical protein